MSKVAVYPLGSARYDVAEILIETGFLTLEAIVKRAQAVNPNHAPGALRYALTGMKRAGLVERNDSRWRMSETGMHYWRAQKAAPLVEQPAPECTSHRPSILLAAHPQHLFTSGGAKRLESSPADRHPMVYRDGALDASALPRIAGRWRIWPDGRKEPAANQSEKAA